MWFVLLGLAALDPDTWEYVNVYVCVCNVYVCMRMWALNCDYQNQSSRKITAEIILVRSVPIEKLYTLHIIVFTEKEKLG